MPLSQPSQLLEKNLELFDRKTLLLNPPADGFAQLLNAEEKSRFYSMALSQSALDDMAASGVQDVGLFGATDCVDFVLYLPKMKNRADMLLNYVRSVWQEDSRLFIVGENKGGIKSIETPLKKQFGRIYKQASGKHCVLMFADQCLEKTSFKLERYLKYNKIENIDLELASYPGVFSEARLDKGTSILFEFLPDDLKGRFVDFGCGAGVIAAYLRKHHVKPKMTLLDDDLLSLAAAQATMQKNGLEYEEALASNGLKKLERKKFDCIISNPPFHQGLKTDYDVAENLLHNAKKYLHPHGRLIIVANDFLQYEPILKQHFKFVDLLGEKHGFKVISANS